VFGEGAEHFGVERAEIEMDGTIEPDAAVLRHAFAEETGEGEKLESALSVSVAFFVQPLREGAVQVVVDESLQQVVVLNRDL
jgi:hypothetical protein